MKSDLSSNYGKFVAKGEVVFVRNLPGPIELVWAYLTEADKRAKWFAGGEMDRFVGGNLELEFKHSNLTTSEDVVPEKYADMHENGHKMKTRITGYEPPRLLSYIWNEGEEPGPNSEVFFELEPIGDQVRLTLTHRRLADPGTAASVGTGWHLHLNLLEAQLKGETPPLLWKTHSKLQPEYAAELGVSLSDVKSCG